MHTYDEINKIDKPIKKLIFICVWCIYFLLKIKKLQFIISTISSSYYMFKVSVITSY